MKLFKFLLFSVFARFAMSAIYDKDGGGWVLVRRCINPWHAATDNLQGTDVYGTPSSETSAQSFSVSFDIDAIDEFMFATGDGTKWLIASKFAVNGENYDNDRRTIEKSSINSSSYQALWYNRGPAKHLDPLISLEDHYTSKANDGMLYVENSHPDPISVLTAHNGANVFVRSFSPTPVPTGLPRPGGASTTVVGIIVGCVIAGIFVVGYIFYVGFQRSKKVWLKVLINCPVDIN